MFKLVMGLILVASIRALAADNDIYIQAHEEAKSELGLGSYWNTAVAKAETPAVKTEQDKIKEKKLNAEKFRKAIAEVDAVEKGKPGTPLFGKNTAAVFKDYFSDDESIAEFNSILTEYKKLVRDGAPAGEETLMKAVSVYYKKENENIKGDELNEKLVTFKLTSSFTTGTVPENIKLNAFSDHIISVLKYYPPNNVVKPGKTN